MNNKSTLQSLICISQNGESSMLVFDSFTGLESRTLPCRVVISVLTTIFASMHVEFKQCKRCADGVQEGYPNNLDSLETEFGSIFF